MCCGPRIYDDESIGKVWDTLHSDTPKWCLIVPRYDNYHSTLFLAGESSYRDERRLHHQISSWDVTIPFGNWLITILANWTGLRTMSDCWEFHPARIYTRISIVSTQHTRYNQIVHDESSSPGIYHSCWVICPYQNHNSMHPSHLASVSFLVIHIHHHHHHHHDDDDDDDNANRKM